MDPDWKNYIPTRLELFESLYRYGLKGSDEAILRVSWKNVFIDSLKKTESQISNARTCNLLAEEVFGPLHGVWIPLLYLTRENTFSLAG